MLIIMLTIIRSMIKTIWYQQIFTGIKALVNYCRYLQELSLSYSLLSDELLLALSSEKQVQLETLRLEVHPETKPLPRVSDKAWFTFSSHLPNINLILWVQVIYLLVP